MSNVNEIQTAIANLPPNELARFREWFEEFDNTAWDVQFEDHSKTGKLEGLAQQALEDYQARKAREI